MKLHTIKFIFFVSLFLSLTIMKADGQGFLSVISDTAVLFYALATWTIIIFVLQYIIKQIRKKEFTKLQKFIIGVVGLAIALFHWTMIKYDPYPTEGPIDSFIHRDQVENKKISDSLELIYGKADSAIDMTIASIDTNEVGVYIWLNHKRIFVRKLTQEPQSQRLQDSITMSIVRKWKNK